MNIRRRVRTLLCLIEFFIVYLLGKIFGLSLIIRYLRNPNPCVSAYLLRAFGAKVGSGTTIKRGLLIDNAYEDENSTNSFDHLQIGANCYIGDNVYFDLSNTIILADDVVVSGRASFITHADCNRSTYLTGKFPRQCKPVRIDQDVWIGFGATILAGVVVEEKSVVAAMALINSNVESKAVYAGIPAKKIKNLEGLSEEVQH